MKFSVRVKVACFAFFILLFGFGLPATAHNSSKGLSAISFKPVPTGLEVRLAMSFADTDILYRLDKDGNETITAEEIAATTEVMKDFPLKELQVSLDGFTAEPTNIKASLQESNFEVTWAYTNDNINVIKMRSLVLKKLPPEHQQFVTIIDSENTTKHETVLMPESIDYEYSLKPKTETTAATTSGVSGWKSFTTFVLKGIDHILFDRAAPLKITDHLLFLLALLVICDKFRDVVKIITSFTIAHSLTLFLVTLNVVSAPSRIIEPLIAATIVYVGLENLLKLKTLRWRWIVTFLFGLIHGCGFASTLQGSIGSSNIVLKLFSFNVGVEIGQILVAAVAIPLFWQIKQVPQVGPRWAPACSVFVVAVGGWWFVQRVWL
jgi:hydrogenase/urease accessory protein HupE